MNGEASKEPSGPPFLPVPYVQTCCTLLKKPYLGCYLSFALHQCRHYKETGKYRPIIGVVGVEDCGLENGGQVKGQPVKSR